MNGGECLCCSKVKLCALTDTEKVLSSFTCPSFAPVTEAEYRARLTAMEMLGEVLAVRALLDRPEREMSDDD